MIAPASPRAHHVAMMAALSIMLGIFPFLKAEPPSEQKSAALEQALTELFRERESDQALQARINQATQLGASKQAILEARFLYHVDRRENQKLIALLPELLEQNQSFDLAESEIFALEEDWLAILEYIRALDALDRNDDAAFKKHITEAFWLSPKQGAAYAGHIEKFKLNRAMKDARFDPTRAFTSLQGKAVKLDKALAEKRALFLHFFSPWSQESQATLAEFMATAEALEQAGVLVATVLIADDEETIQDTRELLDDEALQAAGRWLTDSTVPALNHQLRITSAPTMVLIAQDGSILFNGHPSEPALWQAIKKIAPKFVRPKTPETTPPEE